jgi:radical SAM protein with 4Fe4S-binding SPASM domain
MERRISHGNLRDNTPLKELIKTEIQGFSKDKVEGCKECEFRYACYDCRPDSISNDIYAKPYYCTYDVENGEWLDEDIVIDKVLSFDMN